MGEKIKIYEKERWKINCCLSVCDYQTGLEIHFCSCANKVLRCFPHILGGFQYWNRSMIHSVSIPGRCWGERQISLMMHLAVKKYRDEIASSQCLSSATEIQTLTSHYCNVLPDHADVKLLAELF